MISRRILRVKVMQIMFAQSISDELNTHTLIKQLDQRIHKTKQLYFIYLQYLIKVCEYTLVDAVKRANKYIQDDSDKNVNKDLAYNGILKTLTENETYKSIIKDYSVNAFIDENIVKKLFQTLKSKPKYVKYCETKNKSKIIEADILRYIIRRVIGTSAFLDEELSEQFINIEDDHFLTLQTLQKIIKQYPHQENQIFLNNILLQNDDSEEVNFSKDLIINILENKNEINDIIQPRLKNWDMDRVSITDIVLLKMAIAEFLYFPYIPLKVSLNEYIDISKEYSTKKSKDFINGILDKVMKDLNAKGKIKKLGRGLINN